MDQRWIAVLEYYGVLTYKEAEYLADTIKNSIGSAEYKHASESIKEIMDRFKEQNPTPKKVLAKPE